MEDLKVWGRGAGLLLLAVLMFPFVLIWALLWEFPHWVNCNVAHQKYHNEPPPKARYMEILWHCSKCGRFYTFGSPSAVELTKELYLKEVVDKNAD